MLGGRSIKREEILGRGGIESTWDDEDDDDDDEENWISLLRVVS